MSLDAYSLDGFYGGFNWVMWGLKCFVNCGRVYFDETNRQACQQDNGRHTRAFDLFQREWGVVCILPSASDTLNEYDGSRENEMSMIS